MEPHSDTSNEAEYTILATRNLGEGCRLCSHLNNVTAGTFTICEVKLHRSEESAWVTAHGDVYDVTGFPPWNQIAWR